MLLSGKSITRLGAMFSKTRQTVTIGNIIHDNGIQIITGICHDNVRSLNTEGCHSLGNVSLSWHDGRISLSMRPINYFDNETFFENFVSLV
jgi:hypothetical protein